MAWINLTDDDVTLVVAHLRAADARGNYSDVRNGLAKQIEDAAKPGKHDEAFANAAFVQDPDNIESDYCVSYSEAGAYVMAWIWVANGDAGLCENCNEHYEDGGDGFDGHCPDCADLQDQIENADTHFPIEDWRLAVANMEVESGYSDWRTNKIMNATDALAERANGG